MQLYDKIEIRRILEQRIVYGMYPEIIETKDTNNLKMLADS